MQWWRKRQAKQLLKRGTKLYWKGRFEDALPILERSSHLARDLEDWQTAAEALEIQGNIYRSTGQGEKAKTRFKEALMCREKACDLNGIEALRVLVEPPSSLLPIIRGAGKLLDEAKQAQATELKEPRSITEIQSIRQNALFQWSNNKLQDALANLESLIIDLRRSEH
jgi:hypothetical protein